MSSHSLNPNATAVRANVRASAFGRVSVGADEDDGPTDTSRNKKQFKQSAIVGGLVSVAFSVGYGVVFSRLGNALEICNADGGETGSRLRLFCSLLLTWMWVAAFLTLLLSLLWEPRASQLRQPRGAKIVIQVGYLAYPIVSNLAVPSPTTSPYHSQIRSFNAYFYTGIIILGSVAVFSAKSACVSTELYKFSSVCLYLAYGAFVYSGFLTSCYGVVDIKAPQY